MAATTTAFETEVLGFAPSTRGLMAGAAYKLRQQYLAGAVDPAAHNNALNNPDQVNALNANAEMASFMAIAAP